MGRTHGGAGGRFGSNFSGGGGSARPGAGAGLGGGIPEIPKLGAGSGPSGGAGFVYGMSAEGHDGKAGNINITQNIYSQAMSAADIMEEALFRQREAILFGV